MVVMLQGNVERCGEKEDGRGWRRGCRAKSLYQSLCAIQYGCFWGGKWDFAPQMPGKLPQTLPGQKWGESGACLSVALWEWGECSWLRF
jgi:hypothetical protein